MSISRRGLIAAGLAIAAVGTVGVASTLNAGAAQIAEPTTAVTSSAADKADARRSLLSPPPGLPGGGKAAKGGASSVQAESGAAEDAAPLTVDPVYAPKSVPGFPAPKVKSGKKAVRLPALGAAASASVAGTSAKAAATLAADEKVSYYSQAAQAGGNDGAFGYLTVAKPFVQQGDLHSLAEIAVRSVDLQQVVEVGWTVDPDVNKKSPEPHLFVFHWADGKPACYNGCGWVQYSSTIKPGMALPANSTKRFSIQHFGTSWWIGYENEWVGYFPDALWGGGFTKGGATQWFGEVTLTNDPSCTDMGNAAPAVEEKAASFTRVGFYNGPAVKFSTHATDSALYSISSIVPDVTVPTNPTGFRYGGPGRNSC